MKKLNLLLTFFCLFACRSPQEATQTIIRVRATDDMQALIKSVKAQIYALPKDEIVSDPPAEVSPSWPMKWTLVPESASSSHRFRFVFTGLDEAESPVTQLEIQAEIVEGASRYLYVLLSNDCLLDRCEGGVCRKTVAAAALRTSAAQAAELEVGCMAGSVMAPPSEMPGSDPAMTSGDGDSTKPPTATQTTTGAATMAGSAAPSGNNIPVGSAGKPDSGTVTAPSTAAECSNSPCGPNGACRLNSALPKKYECACDAGFEPDETGATCVARNDCNKDNGGCEDHCEADSLGQANCTCTAADSWLKTDGKQCGKAQPELELSTSTGSVDRTRPQVAFDPSGNGVVAWTETDDAGVHSLWTARYDAKSKSWQMPTAPFLRYTKEAADLHLALDANGSGLLIWTATVESHRQLWAATYRSNKFSLPPVPIADESDGDALMPSLALDPSGDGLVVWTHAVYPRSTLNVATYNASSATFSRMENMVDGYDSFVFGTSVALNSGIGGLVAWTRVPVNTNADGGIDVRYTSSSAVNTRVAGVVNPGETFVRSIYPSSSPDVVLDPQGRGFAVWLQATSSTAEQLNVVSREYVPNVGWSKYPTQTLSERGGVWSVPRIVMGPDGSAFSTWRESVGTPASTGPTALLTRGALRTADKFGTAYELGMPSDATTWNDVDPMALTPESTVTLIDGFQPSWTTAVGPGHTGFIAGASFVAGTPATRQLWLQRMAPDQVPSEPVLLAASDSVPSRPSPVKLGLNANGDGAVVWDRQINGHYHVVVSLLE